LKGNCVCRNLSLPLFNGRTTQPLQAYKHKKGYLDHVTSVDRGAKVDENTHQRSHV